MKKNLSLSCLLLLTLVLGVPCQGDTVVLVNETFTVGAGVLLGGGGGVITASGGQGVLSHPAPSTSGFISIASPVLNHALFAMGGDLLFTVDLVGPGAQRTTENRYVQINVNGVNTASGGFGGFTGPASLSLPITLAPGASNVEAFFIVHNGFGPANGNGNLAIVDNYRVTFTSAIPEPGSLVLLGLGGLTLLSRRRRS